MRSAVKKTWRQDEQRKQTTTNINYIQKIMSVKRKLNNKVKIASDEIEQNNLDFATKKRHQTKIKLGYI